MLKSIDYSVQFPTTGCTFQNRIEFAPGLTAITGRNEAGKTLNLEMIGYCLFGKSALRGLASDYRNLVATLELEIRGQSVIINRAKKETMTVNDVVVAVGADAINREVPALLGFGLDVFNVTCAAQQGDLDNLTNMRPTERRQMVDRLIGLDLLEGVEKECRAEAKTHSTVAQALLLNLVEPQSPILPDDYRPSADVEALLAEASDKQRERNRLLAIREPVAPVEPVCTVGETVAELQAHEQARQSAIKLEAVLTGQLKMIPEPQYSAEDLARAITYAAYQQEVTRRGPAPGYTEDEIEAFENYYDLASICKASDSVHCPKCDHEFLSANPDFDLASFAALTHPPISKPELVQQIRRMQLWFDPLAPVEPFVIPDIQKEKTAHESADHRTDLLNQLGQLAIPTDRGTELAAVLAYQRDKAVYDERRARFDQELADFRTAQGHLASLDDQSSTIDTLHRQLASARTYERDLGQYELRLADFGAGRAEVAARHGLADQFKRGALSLSGTRLRVKQQLAPELGRAASTLLSAMTNGERRSVLIDEDFNILVDAQPLATLSGSGKSVVNLALRIGLGQVLTSRVLPIFLGDEIDKDMDQGRVASTHETLQGLKKYLSQIILITHKPVEADHTVNLDTVSA